ncbi:MAG: adenylate/guanylate cyclase domain-containing protein [Planctomycetota bacterium]|jgi:adenylate cyclase|nr:adenylate/guanylate cyclase domain-containing protein [Planctomycetota bacterium]
MDRTTRRVKTTTVLNKARFRLPDRKALGPLVVGLALTLFAAGVNHFVFVNQTRNLFVWTEGREESADRSLFRQWSGDFASAVRSADDRAFALLRSFFSYHARANPAPGEPKVVVVTIDGTSLRRIGPWPWSRRNIGRILAGMKDARVVGLNLLLHERDATSLDNFLSIYSAIYGFDPDKPAFDLDPEFMNNDLYLSRRIAETRTVSGVYLTGGRNPDETQKLRNDFRVTARLPDGGEIDPARAFLREAGGLVANLSLFRVFKPGMSVEGFINLFPDENGAVEAVPLLMRLRRDGGVSGDAGLVSALPLEMLRLAEGGDGYVLRLSDRKTVLPEAVNERDDGERHFVDGLAVKRGDGKLYEIPLNELGEMSVSRLDTDSGFVTVPAWEVLYGKHPELFRDKYVICDLTVAGAGGVRASVPTRGQTPGVNIHAAMLSAMLSNNVHRHSLRQDLFWQQILTFTAGLLVSLALLYGGVVTGGLAALLALFGLTGGNYHLLYCNDISAGVTVPVSAALAVLVAQSSVSYLVMGRERRFIRTAFSLNVSPSILNYLETHPARLSALGGEQRDMTVLFSDIRGFTAISENMTAPDLARFLNEYLTPMSDIVMQNLGTVDKFMGDALMAFWNAPTNDPDHAENAARAALLMLDKLDDLQEGWTGRGLPRLAIGCGLNSGPMFAGYMGSEQRKNYTVMGDNVNIASRLEGLNKLYASNIVISETTRQDLGGGFHSCVLDKVRVSGRKEPVLIYELLGEGLADEGRAEETATFERVFQLYQRRDFKAAETLLKELVFISPRPLYDMYLDRLAVYLALPPPESWDGTFSVNRK